MNVKSKTKSPAPQKSHTLGKKQFETVNHLGNVLTTLSDRKIAVDANTDGTIDYYQADVLTANDYYPFGAPMPGRLCYNDTTVLWGMDFDYEFFSDTLPFSSTGGAVLSVDYDNLLLISSTGSGTVPPYGAQVSHSLVAGRTYTLWGDARLTMCTSDFVILRIKDGTGSVIDSAVIYDGSGGVYITFTVPSSGTYYFQIYKTDGNACDFDISALYLSHAPVYTTICSDNGNYRYGFNGKENDDEAKGAGNQQDYGMRIYDNRLGRFLSLDPLVGQFPYYTPYQFAGNKPIVAIDIDGLEDQWIHEQEMTDGNKTTIMIFKGDDCYEATRQNLAKSLHLDLSKLPETGAYTSSSKQTEIGGAQSNIRFEYTPTAEVVHYKKNAFIRFLERTDAKIPNLYGENGLKNYSNGLKSASKYLKYTPLAPAAKVLSYGADLIDTGLDFKNKSAADATYNLAVRVLGKAVTEKMGKILKEINKQDLKFVVDEGVSKIKEALIKK